MSCDWLQDMNRLQTQTHSKSKAKPMYIRPTRMGNISRGKQTAMNAMNVSQLVFPMVSMPHCEFPNFLSLHTLPMCKHLNAVQRDMLLHLSKIIARLHDTKV